MPISTSQPTAVDLLPSTYFKQLFPSSLHLPTYLSLLTSSLHHHTSIPLELPSITRHPSSSPSLSGLLQIGNRHHGRILCPATLRRHEELVGHQQLHRNPWPDRGRIVSVCLTPRVARRSPEVQARQQDKARLPSGFPAIELVCGNIPLDDLGQHPRSLLPRLNSFTFLPRLSFGAFFIRVREMIQKLTVKFLILEFLNLRHLTTPEHSHQGKYNHPHSNLFS